MQSQGLPRPCVAVGSLSAPESEFSGPAVVAPSDPQKHVCHGLSDPAVVAENRLPASAVVAESVPPAPAIVAAAPNQFPRNCAASYNHTQADSCYTITLTEASYTIIWPFPPVHHTQEGLLYNHTQGRFRMYIILREASYIIAHRVVSSCTS